MLIFSVFLGLIAGLVSKGSLVNLGELRIRFLWLIVVAFFMKFMLYNLPTWPQAPQFLFWYGPLLHSLVYVLLIYVIWHNRHIRGMSVLGPGVLANSLAIWFNGGQMPVLSDSIIQTGMDPLYEYLASGHHLTHMLASEATGLWFLGDFIIVPVPFLRVQIVSLGDILIFCGMIYLIRSAMVNYHHLTSFEV